MGSSLSAAAIATYERDGVLFPIPALSVSEAAATTRAMADFEQARGRKLDGLELHKSYLLFTWLDRVVRHRKILDAVADVIGPDLLVFSSSLFIKEPGDGMVVSWHQDSTYWSFEPHEVLTAWVALTPATLENGCMRVVPGTHRAQLDHVETYAAGNMLTRGQTIERFGPDDGVAVCLGAGQMSLHNERAAHASGANRSAGRRIGFAIRYVPTHVRQTGGPPLTALLVRGRDHYGHFEPETPPVTDAAPAAVAFHAATLERHRASQYSTA